MKKILFLSLALSGCATATRYEEAVRVEYVGNNTYEVRSDGNGYTADDSIRNYLFRAAYETCAKEEKGFQIVSQNDTGSKEESTYMLFGVPQTDTTSFPGARALIKCEGAVDTKLADKYRKPASN